MQTTGLSISTARAAQLDALRGLYVEALERTMRRQLRIVESAAGGVGRSDLDDFFGVDPQFVVDLRMRAFGTEGRQLVIFPLAEGAEMFGVRPPASMGEVGADEPILEAMVELCEVLNASAAAAGLLFAVAPERMYLVEHVGHIDLTELPGRALAYQYVADAEGPAIAFMHLIGSDLLAATSQQVPAVEAAPSPAPAPAEPRRTPSAERPAPAPERQTRGMDLELEQIPLVAPSGERLDRSLVGDVEVTLRIVVGTASKTLKEIESIGRGSAIELDRALGELADIYAVGARGRKDRLIAQGRVIVLPGGKFAVAVEKIVSPNSRLAQLPDDESGSAETAA